jgi:hypothetical protein
MVPVGGNQVFVDGSARFIKCKQMYYLHTWNPDNTRIAYFYQDDADFDPKLKAQLPNLRFTP